MKQIIHKDTKKNRATIAKLLAGNIVQVAGTPAQKMNGGDALILGNDYLLRGRTREALTIGRSLAEVFPTVIDCQLLKLNALIRIEYLVEANELASELRKAAPVNLGTLQTSAKIFMLLNQSEAAIRCLKKALAIAPGNIDLLQILGECRAQQSENLKAERIFNEVIKTGLRKNNIATVKEAMFQLAALRRLNKDQVHSIEAILSQKNTGRNSFTLAFALARAARKEKDTDKEIHWLKIANQDMRAFDLSRGNVWNREAVERRNELLKALFPKPKPDWIEDFHAPQDARPVYILAMPRSGTTLLEQILGAHPAIGQTGESRAFNNSVQDALSELKPIAGLFPEGLKSIKGDQLTKIVERTLAHERLLTQRNMFVNKNLSNHLYTGLLANVFPQAKFIYLKRNALDNCLSVYQNQIVNAAYSTNLQDILHAQGILENLAQYWSDLFPGRVYTLSYEELVSDGERELRKLLAFLELPWADELLSFSERRNMVRTPSVTQVREKLNTKAVDKWRLYESLLAEVLPLTTVTS